MNSNAPAVMDVTTADFATRVIDASSQQPVLVDFWASWCAPCRALAPVLEQLAIAYGGAFLLAKVDTEAEQQLAAQHGIRSLPTVRLYKNGQAVEEFMGVQPESAIREMLDRHIERGSDALVGQALAQLEGGDAPGAIAALQQALIDDPTNTRIHPAFAKALLANAQVDDAGAVLDALPAEAGSAPEVLALRQQIELARGGDDGESEADLRARIAADPRDFEAKMALSVALARAGRHAESMDELLEIVSLDRAWQDGAARQQLLKMLDMLGDAPVVGEYRRKLGRLLY